jgi:hypothetical protein
MDVVDDEEDVLVEVDVEVLVDVLVEVDDDVDVVEVEVVDGWIEVVVWGLAPLKKLSPLSCAVTVAILA